MSSEYQHVRLVSVSPRRVVAVVGLLLAAALLFAPARALAATCDTSWATATSGLWSDAADWTNGVPTPTSNACIQVPGSYTVTLNGSGASVNSITIGNTSGGGTQELLDQAQPGSNATLTIAATSTVNQTGALALDTQTGAGYSAITGAQLSNFGQFSTVADGSNDNYIRANLLNESGGTVTLSGLTNLVDSNNTITNDGSFTVETGAALSLTAGGDLFVNSGALTNSGSITLSSGASWTQSAGSATQTGTAVQMYGGGTLTDVSGGGTFDLVDSPSLSGTIPSGQTVTAEAYQGHNSNISLAGSSGSVINDGTLVLDVPVNGGDSLVTGTTTDPTLVNNGTIDAQVEGSNDDYLRANLTNNPGATVEVKSGTLVQDSNTTTTNSGLWQVDAAAAVAISSGDDVFDNLGALTNNGSLTLTGGATWQQNATTLPQVGHAVLNYGGTLTDTSGAGSFELIDGTSLSGTISAGQTVTAEALPGHNSGVSLAGPATQVINDGTLTLDSPTSGGLAVLDGTTAAPTLVNNGTIDNTSESGQNGYLRANLDNSAGATLEVKSGTLLQDSNTTTTNDGVFQVDAGAIFDESSGSDVFLNEAVAPNGVVDHGALNLSGGAAWTQSGPESGNAVQMSSGTLTDQSGVGSFDLYDSPTLSGTVPAGQTVTAEAYPGHNAVISISGTVTVAHTGTLALDSPAGGGVAQLTALSGASLIDNSGTVVSTAESAQIDYLQVALTNEAIGQVTVQSGSLYQADNTTTTNKGTFTVDAPAPSAATPTFAVDTGSDQFLNDGTVSNSGAITLTSGASWTQNGPESGTAVQMSSGTLTDETGTGAFDLYDSPVLTGTIPLGQTVTAEPYPGHNANISLQGGTVTNNGTLVIDSPTSGGTSDISGPASLVNNNALDSQDESGNSEYLQANVTNASTGTIDVKSGTLLQDDNTTTVNDGLTQVDAAGALAVNTGADQFANNGAITDNGAITLTGGASWTQNAGGAAQTGKPVFMYSGTLTDQTGAGSFDLVDSPVLTGVIPSGQTVTAEPLPGHNVNISLQGGSVTNDGTLVIDTPAGGGSADISGAPLLNNGQIVSQAEGSNAEYLQANLTNATTGDVQIASGTLQQNDNTTTLNHGTFEIEAGAALALSTGADVFTNDSDGTLQPDLASATSFGVIHLTGGATFTPGGTILPNLVGGYAPPVGTEFDVITGPTTGQFATVANNFLGDYSSQSNFIAVKRDRDSTTTTLVAAPNPSTYGQPVTLTATITTGQGPVGNPTGTVTFFDGATSLGTGTVSTTAGVTTATLTTTLASPLSVGTHSITASYGGDSNFKPSAPSSPPISEVVNKATPSVTVGASNGTPTYGQAVTFTATVTGPTGVLPDPTGTVTFTDGATPLGAPVSVSTSAGVTTATFTTSTGAAALTGGSHSITATYNGDGDYNSAASATPAGVSVAKAGTTTGLISSANPSAYNQVVTLTATVAPSIGADPTGTVTFTANGTQVIGTGMLSTTANVTTATLTLTTPLSPGTYSVVASYPGDGNFGSSASSPALSQVVNPPPPTITQDPSSQTVTAPAPATFTAAATGATSVQWQSEAPGAGSFTNITGATSATYTTPATSLPQSGTQYQAVFTNAGGSTTTTPATLTVQTVPVVTTQPLSQTVTAGQGATFTAAASGSPTPTVQWQVSTDGGATFQAIAGATSGTLTIATVPAGDNGTEYEAVFKNAAGTATSTPATLTVDFAPTVTTQPLAQTVTAGQTATFTAAASGNPSPTVQWQVSTDGGATFTNIAGATSATLSFATTAAQNANQYRAVFTNSIGNATSNPATLTVDFAPAVTSQPLSQTVTAGQTASFTAAASANPTATVQWQVSTDGGATFQSIGGATSGTLIDRQRPGGGQRRRVRGGVQERRRHGDVHAGHADGRLRADGDDAAACPDGDGGSTATFTAAASGNPSPTVQWQVSTDGGATFTNIAGATSATLSFATTVAQTGDEYQAVFTNSVGNVTSNPATLTVTAIPVVTTQPLSQSVAAGGTATFTAAASGTPTPTVQWQSAPSGSSTFTNISGAISDTLTVSNVTQAESGTQYQAVFTNSVGSATSNIATLTVTTTTTSTTTTTTTPTTTSSTTTTTTTSSTTTPTTTTTSSTTTPTTTTTSSTTTPTTTTTSTTTTPTTTTTSSTTTPTTTTTSSTTTPTTTTTSSTTTPTTTTTSSTTTPTTTTTQARRRARPRRPRRARRAPPRRRPPRPRPRPGPWLRGSPRSPPARRWLRARRRRSRRRPAAPRHRRCSGRCRPTVGSSGPTSPGPPRRP